MAGAWTKRDRVPEQRFLDRAPLALEPVRPGAAAGTTELEPPEALETGGAKGRPVQQHVGARRKVFPSRRSPGNHQAVPEREGHESADRHRAVTDQGDPGFAPERAEDGAEKMSTMDRRPELAHIHRPRVVKLIEHLDPAELDGQSGGLGLSDLIANLGVEPPPEAAGMFGQRKNEIDLVAHGGHREWQLIGTAQLDPPSAKMRRDPNEMIHQGVSQRTRPAARPPGVEERHRRDDGPEEPTPNKECGEDAAHAVLVLGQKI